MKNVIGIKLTADTRSFVKNIHTAVRGMASLDYVAGRAASRFKDGFGKAMGAVGLFGGAALLSGMAAAGIAAGMSKLVFGSIMDEAQKFQSAMARLTYLSDVDLGGKIAEDLDKSLRDAVRKTGLASTATTEEIAQSLGNLIKSGVSKMSVAQLADPLAKFVESTFGEMDFPGASAMLASAMNKFEVKGATSVQDKFEKIANAVLKITKVTALSANEMKSLMASMGPVQSANPEASMNEILTFVGALRTGGKQARRASRNFTSFMSSFQKNINNLTEELDGAGGGKTKAAAKLLGVTRDDFLTAKGDVKSFYKLLRRLIDAKAQAELKYQGKDKNIVTGALKNLGGDQNFMEMIQGAEAAQVEAVDAFGNKRMLKGMAALDYILAGMDEAQSLSGTTFDEMSRGSKLFRETWEGTMKVIAGIVSFIKTQIGTAILGRLKPALEYVKSLLERIAAVVGEESNKPIVEMIAIFMLFGTVAAAVLSIIMMGIAALAIGFVYIVPAIGLLLDAIVAIAAGLATLTFPMVMIIVAAIGLLVMQIVALSTAIGLVVSRSSGDLGKWARKTFDQVKYLIAGLQDLWSDGIVDEKLARKMERSGVWEFAKSIFMLKKRIEVAWKSMTGVLAKSKIMDTIDTLILAFRGLFLIFSDGDQFGRGPLSTWVMLGELIGWVLNIFLIGIQVLIVAMIVLVYVVGIILEIINYLTETEWLMSVLGVLAVIILFGLVAIGIALGVIFVILMAINLIVISMAAAFLFTVGVILIIIGLVYLLLLAISLFVPALVVGLIYFWDTIVSYLETLIEKAGTIGQSMFASLKAGFEGNILSFDILGRNSGPDLGTSTPPEGVTGNGRGSTTNTTNMTGTNINIKSTLGEDETKTITEEILEALGKAFEGKALTAYK